MVDIDPQFVDENVLRIDMVQHHTASLRRIEITLNPGYALFQG